MRSIHRHKNVINYLMVLGALIYLFSIGGTATTLAQGGDPFVRRVRALEADETGISNPAGLAFSPRARAFYVV
ncbi:MAG: hypothetical protein P8Y03_28145, partial [Anaerolineales bacterium]